MCNIRLSRWFKNISISIYVPTEGDAEDEDKDLFYEKLEKEGYGIQNDDGSMLWRYQCEGGKRSYMERGNRK